MYAKLTAILLLLAALAWACASNAQEESNKEGVSGKNRNCINTRRIRRTVIVDDRNLLFYLGTRTVLINVMESQCAGLTRDGRFSWISTSGMLCEGDGISGTFDSWCQLGKFHQIAREDADAMREPVAVAPASKPMPNNESLPMPAPSEVSTDTENEPEEPE